MACRSPVSILQVKYYLLTERAEVMIGLRGLGLRPQNQLEPSRPALQTNTVTIEAVEAFHLLADEATPWSLKLNRIAARTLVADKPSRLDHI